MVIIAIIGAIIENAEEVAQGCALLICVIALIGTWAFLDDTWPEIDWVRTAFALGGGLFGALVVFAIAWDSRLIRKLRSRKVSPTSIEVEISSKNDFETTPSSTPFVQVEKLDDVVPQADAEIVIQETEDEWRTRVARELRLSREPKLPARFSKSPPDNEIFSEYIKWKYETKRDDPE